MKKSELHKIIKEEISKVLKESLSEAFNPFLDTEEGGYMREYIDDVASKQGLDLKRRTEFDFAFNVAFKLLKIDYPDMNFNLISRNKESFF